jgi:hypothetical protein
MALVRSTAAGTHALKRLGAREFRLCFGDRGPGDLRDGGVLVLDRAAPAGRSAARVVHLLEHLADDLDRFPAPAVPCAVQLEAVIASEARAIAAELDTLGALAVADGPHDGLADRLHGLEADERRALLERHLRAPDAQTPSDLVELMRGYASRCERARPADPK